MVSSIGGNNIFLNQYANDSTYDKSKTYSSIAQFDNALREYGKEQTKIYGDKFASLENDGKISIDELKSEIKKEFGMYKLVSSEPADVVEGQNLLYIDDSNLQKMADDSEYRAKVFGLMKREHDSLGTNKIKMNGEVVSFNTTGSIFSLSDNNENIGDIPYKGSASSVAFTMTTTKTSNALGSDDDWFEKMMEKLKKKKEEEKQAEKKLEEKKIQEDSLNLYA